MKIYLFYAFSVDSHFKNILLSFLKKDTFTKWNQYVIDHQDFQNEVSEFRKMLAEIKEKLESCNSPDGTVEDVQEKLSIVQVI